MDYMDNRTKRVYEDLVATQKKVNSLNTINKYAWYSLGAMVFLIYLSIQLTKNMMVVFDNPAVTFLLYMALIALVVIAGCSIYSKGPKEKTEFLRKTLLKRIEDKNFCSICKGSCIHKQEFVEKAEKEYKINLYY